MPLSKLLSKSFNPFWIHLSLNFLTFLIVLRICAVEGRGHAYPTHHNGSHFPKWGGYCDDGKRQSPISLSDDDPLIFEELRELTFKGNTIEHKHALIENIGHTIRVSGFSRNIYLSGGPLLFDGIIEYIEFRWWSEHTINHNAYPLECQITFRNTLYHSLEEALEYRDGVTILSALYHMARVENEGIKNILEYIDEIKAHTHKMKPVTMKYFKLSHLVPHLSSFYTYAGSLTTPPCTETITWIVLKESFPVEWYQLEKLKEMEFESGVKRKNNFRYRQQKNNRTITYVDNDRFWTRNTLSGCEGQEKNIVALLSIILVCKEKFL